MANNKSFAYLGNNSIGKFLLIFLLFTTFPMMSQGETVGVFFDNAVPQSSFAAGDIQSALESNGHTVEMLGLDVLSGSYSNKKIVIASESNAAVATILVLQGGSASSNLGEQGYELQTTTSPALSYWALGGDANGAMYGGLDIAESILLYGLGSDLSRKKKPHILRRGIKYHFDPDSRTPSYSGSGTSALESIEYNWDMDYWKSYLDDMARHRMNLIVLWSLNPFPSMVKVPEYPNAALEDVKRTTIYFNANGYGWGMSTEETRANLEIVRKMTIEQKEDFWRAVMQYGYDRGVQFFVQTWNVYTYGTEDTYPELINYQAEGNTDYYYHTVKAFLIAYPLLKGIGTYPSEGFKNFGNNQKECYQWLYDSYGRAVNEVKEMYPDRDLEYIAAKGGNRDWIDPIFKDLKVPYSYDIKYTRARFLSVTEPDGAEIISKTDNGRKWFILLRDGDYYMGRWYNPYFMKEFISNIPVEHVTGLEMGANLITYGRESGERNPLTPRQTYPQKHWFKYSLLGRYSYDPELPVQLFKDMLAKRNPDVDANALHEAWVSASLIGHRMSSYVYKSVRNGFEWSFEANYSRRDFEGYTRTFPGYKPIRWFAQDCESHNNSDIVTVKMYKEGERDGTLPLELADEVDSLAEKVLAAEIGRSEVIETQKTIGDIRSKGHLGHYYADMLRAAFYYETGDKSKAIEAAAGAVCHWKNYAAWVDKFYEPVRVTRFLDPTWPDGNGYLSIPEVLDLVIEDYRDVGGTGTPECPCASVE